MEMFPLSESGTDETGRSSCSFEFESTRRPLRPERSSGAKAPLELRQLCHSESLSRPPRFAAAKQAAEKMILRPGDRRG